MKPIRPATLAVLCASFALAGFGRASAADGDPCHGTRVRSLAGPKAVTVRPIADVADLRRRLPDLEGMIRSAVAADSTLDPAVADALIAAVRDGSAVSERPMARDEGVRWMAYQPAPGRFDLIRPVCLDLRRSYDAFEISALVPEPEPAAPATHCAVAATRDCSAVDPRVAIDLRGSSPGARVTMAAGDRPETAVGGTGDLRTAADPAPDLDLLVTVRAAAPPAPARRARVHRFLLPKICGNLAYLGEGQPQTLPAVEGTAAGGCEKSVRLARCPAVPPSPAVSEPVTPPAAPEPTPPVLPPGVADLCEGGWIARPFAFGYFPTGDPQEREVLLPIGPARERFELKDGFGLGGALERRFGPVVGIEAAALFGRGTSKYELDAGSDRGEDSHRANFYAFTVGPNFHLLGCDGADLYLGPFVGYGGFADPNYWALDHHFHAAFDGDFIWGGQLGLDVPFRTGPWGFHGGVRYIDLSQDTDAGTLAVDPLIVEAGLSYRF